MATKVDRQGKVIADNQQKVDIFQEHCIKKLILKKLIIQKKK